MALYEKRPLFKRNIFQVIFRRHPRDNFIIEVQNLLADNYNNIQSIKKSDVDFLIKKYKIKEKDFDEERKTLLNTFIVFCLYDKRLSEKEKADIKYLSNLLWISDDFLEERLKALCEEIYRDKVQDVISDNIVTSDEKKALVTLQAEFGITVDEAKSLFDSECKRKVQTFVSGIIERERMSPDDEAQLDAILKGLNLNADYSGGSLAIYKRYYQIESGTINPIESPIKLQKTENLYYTTHTKWYEERMRTVSTGYSGVSSSFKICKGVRIRLGRVAPSRQSEEYMKCIDEGELYLTNKRIIFTGKHGNKTLLFTKILDFTFYRNGIEVGKDTGKKPFFRCADEDVKTLGLFLTRLWNGV